MSPRHVRRAARRFLALLVVVTAVAVTARPAVHGAGAGVPPPTDLRVCAAFAALQERVVSVGGDTTPKETFAAIHRTARVFRRAASNAPVAIADDMNLLAESFGDLDRALAALSSRVRPAQDRRELDQMLTDLRETFAGWTRSQDVAALGAAQRAVDDWLEATCGFRLGAGDSGTGTTTASCASAEAAVAAVLGAWAAGDRTAAARCGTEPAVAQLFTLPAGVALTPAGCTGVDSTTVDCSYRYEGGSLVVTVTGSGVDWKVTRITGRPD